MTTKDILVGFGGIDSDLVLAAAPSEKFLKEKRVKNAPADRRTSRFIKLGAIAAAIVLMICSVPMLLDLTPSDDFVSESYTEVLAECDLAVFGTYKGKTEKLTYSEYTFEVTEVLKGEVTQKEITVRSEKKSIFSEDEMEKHAQSVNASFEEGNEYFLTLQGEGEKVIEFLTEQIVNTADLASANLSDDLRKFLEENGVTIETTRGDLKEFFKYIFGSVEQEATGTTGLVYELSEDLNSYVVTGYEGTSKYVTVPSSYDGLPVTKIGDRAFENNRVMVSIHLPNTIKSIGESAFHGSFLISIKIPEGVTRIEAGFAKSSKLKYAKLANSITYIGPGAFIGCSDMEKIVLPENLAYIDRLAFAQCVNLTEIHIPKNITSIAEGVFRGCKNLSSITVDKNNSNYRAINNCLIDIKTQTLIAACNTSVIPTDPSITKIGVGAFQELDITEIVIPENILSIGVSAFSGCKSLSNITISEGVEYIGMQAFGSCIKLTEIYLPESITKIDEIAFEFCRSLTYVQLSNGITSIGKSAFTKCTSLTKIYIPDSVTHIGEGAFEHCNNLSYLRISKNIETVGKEITNGCYNLKTNVYDNAKYLGNEENPYLLLVSCDNIIKLHQNTQAIAPDTLKNVTNITFDGTKEQWNILIKDYDWGTSKSIIIRCSDGVIIY